MKRMLAWILAMGLLASICACGKVDREASAEQAVSDTERVIASDNGEVVPAAWTEEAVDNEGWGFLVAESQSTPYDALPERWKEDGGCFYTLEDLLLTRYDLSGQVLCSLQLNTLLPEDHGEEQFEDIFTLRFGETDLWLIRTVYTVVDEQSGETERAEYLEHWTQEGQQLLCLPLDASFDLEEGDEVMGLELSPDGAPLLFCYNTLLLLDENGAVQRQFDTSGVIYSTVRDRDGQVYIKDESTDLLYTIDWDQGAPGQQLFQPGPLDQVRPGSGPYDFFLISDALLKGVDVAAGVITTLLEWEDCGLEGMVQDVTWVDENTYQASGYSLPMDQMRYLDVTKVPEDQIPEKTVIKLAVPIGEGHIQMGMTWTDVTDSFFVNAVTDFNLTNGAYKIEAVTYTSAQELQLMMTSDPPDLICWDSVFQDPPSMQNYARRGLLTDLEPLIEADPELDLSDFYPNVVEAVRDMGGGLYTIPLQFYLRTLSAPAEYVGTEMGWTCAELFEVAQNLPEDMVLMAGWSQTEMLSHMLDVNIQRFVDQAAGTCDFQNQDFYDLLTLCRDYFPADGTGSGDSLLNVEAQMGTMGSFAATTLKAMEAQGRTLIGYPGAGGNGMNIVPYQMCSICALGPHQEGAWAFYRTLLRYDFQYALSGLQLRIRMDAQTAKEEWYLEYGRGCTEEESLAARELVLGAECITVYNSPLSAIVLEEADAFFAGDKTAEETAALIENRANIYLAEQG